VNVLFLTSRLPFPPVGGDRLRTFQVVKHLSRRHRVTIASFVEHAQETDAAAPYRDLYDRLIPVVLPKRQSHLNCLRGLASSEPLQVHYYASPAMRDAVSRELATTRYDAVFCHLIRMAQYLPDHPGVRKVLDFCDAISLLHERSLPLRHGLGWSSLINAIEAKRVGPYERSCIRKADVSIFISSVDADYFQRAGVKGHIAVMSNGVDIDGFPFNSGPRDENRIVFVGNMRTFPNTDAVVYFVEEVFPLIRAARPETRFYVVGNEPSPRVQRLHDGEHVFVTGRVDSVVPYLSSAAVTVAPMRAAAGIQNKILESLAVGTPVVTTHVGAEGLDPGLLAVTDSTAGVCARDSRTHAERDQAPRALAGRTRLCRDALHVGHGPRSAGFISLRRVRERSRAKPLGLSKRD
jgi:sugar transferase (PEP-CTERM/EpsH1 system associated)